MVPGATVATSAVVGMHLGTQDRIDQINQHVLTPQFVHDLKVETQAGQGSHSQALVHMCVQLAWKNWSRQD